MSEFSREGLERICRGVGIEPDDMDQAVALCEELLHVEDLVTGASNLRALSRALDVDDDGYLRLGCLLSAVSATSRLEERWKRMGRPLSKAQTRDVEAINEGITQGVELAIAIQRLARRVADG